MAGEKDFFQDFLFEDLPVDEYDNPIVVIEYFADNDSHLLDPEIISFDRLLRLNKRSEWDTLHEKILNKTVIIQDDVTIINEELSPYKDFYLKAYYHDLSKYAKNCYVGDKNPVS